MPWIDYTQTINHTTPPNPTNCITIIPYLHCGSLFGLARQCSRMNIRVLLIYAVPLYILGRNNIHKFKLSELKSESEKERFTINRELFIFLYIYIYIYIYTIYTHIYIILYHVKTSLLFHLLYKRQFIFIKNLINNLHQKEDFQQ